MAEPYNYNVPAVNLSGLAQLPQIYQQGVDWRQQQEKRDTLSSLGDMIAAGNLDYNKAAGLLAKVGDVGSALGLMTQGQEQAALNRYDTLNRGGGGVGGSSPQTQLQSYNSSALPSFVAA